MGKNKAKKNNKKKELKRKRLIEMYISQGMELEEAIIKTQRKNTPSVVAKKERMINHFKDSRKFNGTLNKIKQAKRKRDAKRTPIIPVGFEYKKR